MVRDVGDPERFGDKAVWAELFDNSLYCVSA